MTGIPWSKREAESTSVDDAIERQLPILREGLDMLAAGDGPSHKALCEQYRLPKRPQGGGGGGNG